MNLLRKPSCGTRLCLRRQGRLANRRPLRHPRLAASATGGASAAMPDTLRVPRLDPSRYEKRETSVCLSLFFGRGRRTWSRLPPRVLLPSGERPAPTEAGAETGAAERHWRSLTPRHAVLEWMWENTTGSKRGPVLPDSSHKSQNEWCWFGAVSSFRRRIVYRLPLLPSKEKHLRQEDGQADQDHGRVGPGGV